MNQRRSIRKARRIVVIGRPRRNRVTYPDRTARFGAKTIAGAGAFRPTDSNGNAYDLTAYNSLVSGSLGSYTPSISGGGLRFTGGGAGAPAGAVLRCTHANGTIDITIGSLIANTYSVASLTEADAAYKACVLGDRIELRANAHNASAARVIVSRTSSPTGTWTGTSALSDGNWVVLTRDPGATVTIGAMEIAGGGGTHPRYLRLNDLDFVTPLNADSNGLLPAGAGGVLQLNSTGTHLAITNCRFSHASVITGQSSGVARIINLGTIESFWIEGNTIEGGRHGIIGSLTNSVVRRNTIRRILSDAMQIGRCNNVLIEGNVIDKKLNGYTATPLLGITRGTTTVITVANGLLATVNEAVSFDGVSGAIGAFLNRRVWTVTARTATTITLNANTSGQPDWDGVAGTAHILGQLHGDHMQFGDDPGGANLQDNVTIRGNTMIRGEVDGYFAGGQGIFLGGTLYTRSNWLVEGNIYCDGAVRGISFSQGVNCTVRSNTIIRQLGAHFGSGGSIPSIRFEGASSSGNIALDNISNGYAFTGVVTDTNNATVTLTDNTAVPANATDVANYAAAFVSPNTVANVDYDPKVAFATRTDAGSAYPGPIYPGATPYMNFTTLVYSNPR